MTEPSNTPPSAAPAEQVFYARWLAGGVRVGMTVVVLAFVGYLVGWLPSDVPPAELSRWWGLPLSGYLQRTGSPSGWGWLSQLGHGDAAALFGVAVLASAAVPALLALVLRAWSVRDRVLALLAVAQVVVIVLAASGWLTLGH